MAISKHLAPQPVLSDIDGFIARVTEPQDVSPRSILKFVIPAQAGIHFVGRGLLRQTYFSKFISLWLLKQSLFSADISIAESPYSYWRDNILGLTMFGLFNKKKKHLSRADFVALMLSFQQEMLTVLSTDAQRLFQPTINAEKLRFECEILSMCILSLTIQDNDLDLRNTIYVEYCRHSNFDKDATKQFLEHLDMRCARYYDAFNEFVKDHGAGGSFLGSVVANGLKGGESDKLELSMIQGHAAFSLFINSLKSTFEFIGELKKKYDLSKVSSVFVE